MEVYRDFAVKKIMKLAFIGLGLLALVLGFLEYKYLISVNWTTVETLAIMNVYTLSSAMNTHTHWVIELTYPHVSGFHPLNTCKPIPEITFKLGMLVPHYLSCRMVAKLECSSESSFTRRICICPCDGCSGSRSNIGI